MKPELIFVFHFNQAITPFATIADEVCYKNLLNVLRKHKDIKFTLHISGSLVDSLLLLESETLKLIKQGISDGQFEILGSTYAQNVMYSTDDISNRIQIELHRKILKNTFDVESIGFWLPERCWRKEFLKILLDYGYKYTFIEKAILRKNGIINPVTPVKCSRRLNADYIIGIPDDETFRQKVNLTIWSGIKTDLLAYLNHLSTYSPSQQVVVYAEDAEASGLWGYEKGTLPQVAWQNLDSLISELKKIYKFTTAHKFLNSNRLFNYPIRHLTKNGQADWMVRAVKLKHAPYHENGFRDWFDFNMRSKKVLKYRKIFKHVARQFRDLETKIFRIPKIQNSKKVKNLIHYAKKIFASHQYEFGCIGIGSETYLPFSGIKNSLIPLKALFVQDGCYETDINEDGITEIVIRTKTDFFVFSKYGARLLYWYDLKTGCEVVGNSIVPRNPKDSENDNLYIPVKKIRKISSAICEKDIKKYKKRITINNAWFRWYADTSELTKKVFQYNYPQVDGFEDYYPPQKCLNDFIFSGDKTILEPNSVYTYDRKQMLFEYNDENLKLKKKLFVEPDGVKILYELSGRELIADYRLKIINGYNSDTAGLKIKTNCKHRTQTILSFNENIAILEFNFQKKPLQKFYISLTKL